jgi:hypothetical protein
MVERVNSSIIYLTYCKNLYKCHNVLLPSTTRIIIIIKTPNDFLLRSFSYLGLQLLNKIRKGKERRGGTGRDEQGGWGRALGERNGREGPRGCDFRKDKE